MDGSSQWENDHSEEQRRLMDIARINRALRVHSAINQALLHATSEADLIHQTCRIAVEVGGYRMAWVGFVEHTPDQTVRPICHVGYEAGFLEATEISWSDSAPESEPTGAAIRMGTPIFISDISTTPDSASWRTEALQREYWSAIALPLYVDGQIIGTLTLFQDHTDSFTPEERQLLTEMAGNLSYGLQALRARQRQLHAERALHIREDRFQFLFETMAQGVVLQDAESRIIEANHAAAEILGLSLDQLLGKTTTDPHWHLVHEDGSPLSADEMPSNIALRTGQTITNVVAGVFLPERNTYRWLIVNSVPRFHEGSHTPYLTMTTFTDITERKHSEERLLQSEKRFRSLFETMTEGVAIHEVVRDDRGVPVDYRILEINRAYARQTGITLERARGELGTVVYGTHTPPYLDIFTKVADTGIPYAFETFFSPLQKYFSISVFSPAPGSFATVFEDITERKRTEEALKASEEQFRTMFNRSPIPMAIYRSSGEVEYLNDRFISLFGYTLEDLPSIEKWWPLAYPDEEYRKKVLAIWQSSVQKAERTHTDIQPHEYQVTGKDGTVRTVEIFGTRIGDRELAIWNDITERKQAEDALRQSEAMLRAIYNAAIDVSFIVTDAGDAEPKVLEFSPGAERIFGYTREEMVGNTVNRLHRAEDITHFPVITRAMREGKKGFSGETVLIRKNGEEFPALFSTYPLFDEHGEMYAALGVSIDISERKRAEETMRESEERLSLVIRNSPDMIFIMDKSLHYIWLPKTLDIFSSRAVIGITDHDLFSPEEADRLDAINRQVMATGESIRYNLTLPSDGGFSYYDNTALPWRNAEGQIIGIVVYAHDITEIKLAEQSLARERAYLDSAIELLPFPILFVTPQQQVFRQNRASQALLHSPNGQPWWGLQLLDPQTRMPIPLQDWPVMRAVHGETMPTTEWILALPAGREIPILLQGAPIYIDHEFVAAVVAFQDISALKEADRAKNQFLMVLSHEVKTPLTSIIGWAQMAQSAPDIVPEALKVILRNAYEQKHMIERLLILSTILTGKLYLHRECFDLLRLIEEAVAAYQETARQRDISFTPQVADGDTRVFADRRLLHEALRELLDNAVRFSEAGAHVIVSMQRVDGQTRMTVQDTGRGIAPEQLSILLKPFQQIQREETKGGLGIGLAIVRGIVSVHGGRVTIASDGIGQGTTVTIELPQGCDKNT